MLKKLFIKLLLISLFSSLASTVLAEKICFIKLKMIKASKLAKQKPDAYGEEWQNCQKGDLLSLAPNGVTNEFDIQKILLQNCEFDSINYRRWGDHIASPHMAYCRYRGHENRLTYR